MGPSKMDNSEFEKRALADPDDNDPVFLAAIEGSPERKQLLEEARSFNRRLVKIANAVPVPSDHARRLKALAADEKQSALDSGNVVKFPRSWQPLRLAAMAAALVVAVGLGYSALYPGNQPAAMALGQQAVDHVYMEQGEIDARQGTSFQLVNEVMANVGVVLANNQALTSMQINFAKPCIIVPENNSAHLVMEGAHGAINIIVIDSNPIRREFSFSDDRYTTVIFPFENGNLILVGEKDEPLGNYRELVTENMEWLI